MGQRKVATLAIPNRQEGVASHRVELVPLGRESVRFVRGFRDAGGHLWYCAADVCALLGSMHMAPAVAKFCEEQNGLLLNVTVTRGTTLALLYIRQDNLRYLIVRCNTSESKAYAPWAMDDLASSARKLRISHKLTDHAIRSA